MDRTMKCRGRRAAVAAVVPVTKDPELPRRRRSSSSERERTARNSQGKRNVCLSVCLRRPTGGEASQRSERGMRCGPSFHSKTSTSISSETCNTQVLSNNEDRSERGNRGKMGKPVGNTQLSCCRRERRGATTDKPTQSRGKARQRSAGFAQSCAELQKLLLADPQIRSNCASS